MDEARLKNIPATKIQKIIIAVLVVLIAVTFGVFLYFYGMNSSAGRPKDAVVIRIPEYRINNAHYIYPSVSFELDGKTYAVRMISIDTLATVFHLNTSLNVPGRQLSITDDSGRRYEPDYARVSTNASELFFKPFESPVKYFTLEISDMRVPFAIEGKFVNTPVGYAKGMLDVTQGDSVFMTGPSIFSSAFSSFCYLSKPGAGGNLFFDGDYSGTAVLTDGAKKLNPTNHLQYLYDDGAIVGRYDFPPVSNLDSTVALEIGGLLEYHSPALELEMTMQDRNVPFAVGSREVTLEGFARQGDYYVLVLHGTDASSDNNARIETRVGAELIIRSETGELVLNGECRSGPIGSDVLFDVSGAEAKIPRGDLKYFIKINDLTFSVGSVTAFFDIGPDAVYPAEDHDDAVAAALAPYGDMAQLAAYAYDGDKFYAVVLERADGMVITHKDSLRRTSGGWVLE